MEKTYWLGRKRASLKLAQNATSPEARLVHYDLAGRYSLKAMSAAASENKLAALPLPAIDADPLIGNLQDVVGA